MTIFLLLQSLNVKNILLFDYYLKLKTNKQNCRIYHFSIASFIKSFV